MLANIEAQLKISVACCSYVACNEYSLHGVAALAAGAGKFMMSAQDSLKAAMRDTLESKGIISQVKAQLRAAIFQSLAEGTDPTIAASAIASSFPSSATPTHPPAPPENMIINELIKEYLAFNGLEHSLSVFQLEARVPNSAVPRAVLANELNMAGAPTAVPLLYAMIHESQLSKDLNRTEE